MSDYVWVITRDLLKERFQDDFTSAVGVWGPSDARYSPDEAPKHGWSGYRFTMYDDDREAYYQGTMYCAEPDEDACFGPLGDYGMPGSGCTEIRYHGHREMDCG